ncbi:hypothetical protein ACOY9H_22300 [Enterobacter hormaechei]|uniref:hypothetical protein n=1 Tax=Enterobacter hormaechei TaxID=158836 RepID=UPI0013FD3BFC|nr:hypothetical protein [Enterobacter hormaechei]
MSNIDKQALTAESARESGNILLIVAARMARRELFTPLHYVSELPQKVVSMRVFREALERSEETLQREVCKIVDGHDRMQKKLKEAEAKLEAAEKRIAELEARTVTLPAQKYCPAEYADSVLWGETEVWNQAISECAKAIRAAGIGKGE